MIKKISYSEFIREVESNILDFMPEDFANAEVSVRKVTKVNVDKYALNIRRTNEKISPTLYLNSFYKEGKYLNDTLKLIADTYVDYVNDSTINFRNINVVDKFLDVKNIIFSLINAEKNAELLKNVPHRMFYDLAIVYRSVIGVNANGIGSILIRNEHMPLLKLSEDDLYKNAFENSKKMFPITISSIDKYISESRGVPFPFPDDEDNALMYIISNNVNVNGAGYFLYMEETLEKLAQKYKCNLYILPSSINETIAALDFTSEINSGCFINMVRRINVETVDENDILSDNIYYYDRNKKKISMITKLGVNYEFCANRRSRKD